MTCSLGLGPYLFGPGVPGAICLVLGLYALNQLPLDHAGLALVLLGLAFAFEREEALRKPPLATPSLN